MAACQVACDRNLSANFNVSPAKACKFFFRIARLLRGGATTLAVIGAFAVAACGAGGDSAGPGGAAVVPKFALAAGAQGVVVADAPLPRPATAPCTVTLFSGFSFDGFDAQPFPYPGSGNCPGPYAKVVLEADYAVNAGVQYDRTALISVGGVNLYFGTTQEPSAAVAPGWHVERDLTDYANALTTSATGYARLDNLVNDRYTGVITGSARLVFYRAPWPAGAATVRMADSVVPFAGDPVTGDPANLASSGAALARTLSLPTNLVRLYLDVFAQSQGQDEFQYACVPDALVNLLQSCGGGSFREVLVSIDGQPAGLAPVVPRVYTGGFEPGLWRPTPAVEALNFIPSRIELTPFAGPLSDGKPHAIAISVEGAGDHFAVLGNLLVYRDAGAGKTGAAVTANTLASGGLSAPALANGITSPDGLTADGSLGVSAARSFVIAGYVDTSQGRVTTRVEQRLSFSNQQNFTIGHAAYEQNIDQLSTLDSTVTTTRGSKETVDTVALRYPLSMGYQYNLASSTQTVQFTQSITHAAHRTTNDQGRFSSNFRNTHDARSFLVFDANGAAQQRTGQSSQDVSYSDSVGSCYDRHIVTAAGALTTFTDGAACASNNVLNWMAQPDGAPAQTLLHQFDPLN